MHVDGTYFPFLDEGSNPSGSTFARRSFHEVETKAGFVMIANLSAFSGGASGLSYEY